MQDRNKVRAVVINGKPLELRILLPRRQIIVAVVFKRKIACPHRLPQNAQGDSLGGVEELDEQFFSLGVTKL